MNKNLKALLRVLHTYRWKYALSTLLLVLSLFSRSLEPKVLQVLVDYVYGSIRSPGQAVNTGADFFSRLIAQVLSSHTSANLNTVLISLGLVYLVISFFRGSFLFASSALKEASTEGAVKQLRDRAFAHIQRLPMSYFASISRGELVQRCTGDIDTVKRFLHHQIVAFIRLSSIFLFAFLMMASIYWPYALLSVAMAPVIGGLGYIFFNRERKVWQAHEAEADRLNAMVQENLNGIRVVKAFANESYETDKFDRQNQRKRRMGLRQSNLHSIYWPLSDFLVNLQIVLSILGGGYFVFTRQITLGELLGFYAYVNSVAWPMREVGRLLSQMGIAFVAIERVSEIMETEPESDPGQESPAGLAGEIEFRNVSFRYRPSDPDWALHEVSFCIRAGEKVALIGPTGAGKSTVVQLLLGLHPPTQGEIYLDGKNLRHYSKRFLRQRIGVALQKAFLFSTTIRSNIAYTNPDSEEPAIEEAARLSQAHDMQRTFPGGYHTVVGEKGVTLSGGQKQRVALARTLLAGPDVLVLDDVTSAVDTVTEQAIFEALAGPLQHKTTLLISHRLTSIGQAGRILVLDKGRLVQEGTAAGLSRINGYYQQIHRIQAAVEDDIVRELT